MKLLSITLLTAAVTAIAGSAIAAPVREYGRHLERKAQEHQRAEQQHHESQQHHEPQHHESQQHHEAHGRLGSASTSPAPQEYSWRRQPASFNVAEQAPSKGVPLGINLVPDKIQRVQTALPPQKQFPHGSVDVWRLQGYKHHPVGKFSFEESMQETEEPSGPSHHST